MSQTAAVTQESQLVLLRDLAKLVDSDTDVAECLDSALRLMATHLGMMRGTITLISPDSGEIRIEAAYGLKPSQRRRGRYLPGEGVTGRVIASGEPMCIADIGSEPLFLNRTGARDLGQGNAGNLGKSGISFVCVPIRRSGQVVGTLSVDSLLADAATLEEELRLLEIIATLLAHTALESQDRMNELRVSPQSPRGFVGNSESIQQIYAQIAQVAPSTSTVFLQGESGTGKELAAKAIHATSARNAKPFISLNCAALPENLIESELFGHERGSFTGASHTRKGRFELAQGGTLFLDEIGELSPITQAKLLRVLQERSFERIGGMESIHCDVRIIAATNRDLAQMVEAGVFRRDLFYRLNVFPIYLPPLRQRPEDILPLANHFLRRFAGLNGRKQVRLSLAVMDLLQRYSWPGNIRELQNIMERAVLLLGSEGLVLPQHLPPGLQGKTLLKNASACNDQPGSKSAPAQNNIQAHGTLRERLEEVERASIVEALTASGGHLGRAATALGLTERIMGLRMTKYALSYKNFRHSQIKQPYSKR